MGGGYRGFKEEDFYRFPHYKSFEILDPLGGASLDPRGWTGRIYTGDY